MTSSSLDEIKREKDLSTMANQLVYSTDGSIGKESKKGNAKDTYTRGPGPCKMRLETKGRAGKAVTVLFNLPFSEMEARDLMKTLQSSLGCGATMKGATVEFRGDMRAKIEEFLGKKGVKVVRAGG